MFRKILAPLDGSPLAEKSLPYVEALARQFDAEVILGWVVPIPTPAATSYSPELHGMTALFDTSTELERANRYLKEIAAEFEQRGIRTSIRVVEGVSIAGAIVDIAAKQKVDLIVKTSYARLGLSRWLHGNIAAEVLKRAPCPLFLVKVSDEDPVPSRWHTR
jgi:nucleotide-binding universal stress UspA family protein